MRDIATNYWPFLIRNARAWQAGCERVDHRTERVTYRDLKVVRYRVWCLEVLQSLYRGLDADARTTVDAILAPHGTLECIDVDSGLAGEHELPLSGDRPRASRWQSLKLFITGTPWDMPRRS